MEEMQVHTELFEEILIDEMDYKIDPIKLEPEEDQLTYTTEEQRDVRCNGMETTEVKTEQAEEVLISEIEIEEHAIKLEAGEDQLDCLPVAGTSCVRSNEEKSFKCNVCQTRFSHSEILDWHIENCHGANAIVRVLKVEDKVNYWCCLCKTLHTGLEVLIPHLLWQHQVKNWPFRCNNCNITFMTKHHFMDHKLICKTAHEHHKILRNGQQPSNKILSSPNNAMNRQPRESQLHPLHQNAEGKSNNTTTLKRSNKCGECAAKYVYPEMLAWHSKNCHGPDAKIKVLTFGKNAQSFQCVLCQSQFKSVRKMIWHLHVRHNHLNLPFQCNVCHRRQFFAKGDLMQHQMMCKSPSVDHNNDHQQHTQEFLSPEIDDHTIKVEPIDDQLDLAMQQNNAGIGEPRNFKCAECHTGYAYREMLDWHIENCHGPDPTIKVLSSDNKAYGFQCVLCKTQIKKFSSIVQHLLTDHHLSKLPFQCNICNCKQFTSKGNLLHHELLCSKSKSQRGHVDLVQPHPKEFPCPEIDAEDHIFNDVAPPLEYKLAECRVLVPKLLECHFCKFYTDNKTHLATHMQSLHTSNRTRSKSYQAKESKKKKCVECGIVCCSTEMFAWHTDYCHGPDAIVKVLDINKKRIRYRCLFCKNVFLLLRSIIQHLRMQHRLRNSPLHCNLCDKSFLFHKHVTNHRRVCHSNYKVSAPLLKNYKKPFVKCKMCDEIFESELEMKTHISDFHAVLQYSRFKCGHCNESFYTYLHLKSHSDKLHPEKTISLQCDKCGAEFASIESYNRHKKNVHRPVMHTCDTCAAKFPYPSNLKIHIQTVHLRKAFLSCNFCSCKFQSETLLQLHVRNAHADQNF